MRNLQFPVQLRNS